jgi:threonine/homoserine/homoserine lactone efflux protein
VPSPTTLLVFSGTALLLLVVPGPAVFYILARSASQGVRAGLVSVAGIHTGTVLHVLAATAGLSAVLASSATAFAAVKLAGSAYLIYLGILTLLDHRRQSGTPTLTPMATRSMRRIFADAVVLNILNPKTAIFFLVFVPQFVRPSGGEATIQVLVLGGMFIALGLLSDGAYAVVGGWIGRRLRRAPKAARRTNLIAGSTYLGVGLAAATSGTTTGG